MMNRRKFLRNGSLTGISLTALAAAGCHSDNKPDSQPAGIPGRDTTAAAGSVVPADFAFNEATIDILQQKMQEGAYTARSITELYLKRIGEIDKKGPSLHAVIEVNPDALSIADEMD